MMSQCASCFFCLPKRSNQEKGSPIVWPTAPWKWIDLGGHASTRILGNCSCIALLPSIHGHMLDEALRASLPVDPPKSIHFQHTKRAILKTQTSSYVFFFPPSSPRQNCVQIRVNWQGCQFRPTRARSACRPTLIWALF